MKKYVFCMMIYSSSLAFIPVYGQGVSVAQGFSVGIDVTQDIIDFAMLTGQGAVLVDRIDYNIKKMALIKERQDQINAAIASKGYQSYLAYAKKRSGLRVMTDDVKMLSYGVAGLGILAQSVLLLIDGFALDIANKASKKAADITGVTANLVAQSGKAIATAGVSTIFDVSPVTNAVTLLKGENSKGKAKRFLFELIDTLDKLESGLDKLYVEANRIYGEVSYYSQIREMYFIGKRKYEFVDGYIELKKEYAKEDAARAKKEKEAQDKIRAMKKKVSQNK